MNFPRTIKVRCLEECEIGVRTMCLWVFRCMQSTRSFHFLDDAQSRIVPNKGHDTHLIIAFQETHCSKTRITVPTHILRRETRN
jgi:hypothetical protein